MMLCREFFSSHEMSTLYSGEVQGDLIFPRNYFIIFVCNGVIFASETLENREPRQLSFFHTMLIRVGQFVLSSVC